jgi:mono/diheme cytochrome c family protein
MKHRDTEPQRQDALKAFVRVLSLWLCVSVFPITLAAQAQTPAAVFTQYCITCHNSRLKTAGLVIDPAEAAHASTNPELWEKVIRKLRSESMPPAAAPRPSPAVYDSVATFLETEIDHAAAAKPAPGTLPLLHRLTRTEYQNAVRDLLALDSLPKEMDISLLLPADNVSSGFDNLADLLFVSPATMERYLDAARKISRLAVGDPEMPVMVNIHRMHPEQWQEERVDELSFGTRGGLAVRSYFPLDADYNFKLDVAGAARDTYQIEISIDGERMQLIPIGGNGGGRGGRGRGGRGAAAEAPMEYRIPVKAGSRLVGVTFIERNQARDEETLKPRIRARGSLPALAGVTISGPYNVKGSGDTPARRRLFVCKPASGLDDLTCAKKILTTLTRRAYRRPSTDADVQRLLPFYTAGKMEGGFDRGIQKALERVLVSPQFMFRIESEPTNVAAGTAYRISDLELASRLSFFIWSSIPDDELLDAAVAGKLKNAATLEQQVRRMLADARSESMVTNFAAQWLYLRDIEAKQPDELLFPNWDETLREAFRKETELFVDSIVRSNASIMELLTANYTFVNERLAKHYGIPNVSGSFFRRVTLPEGSPRGGLLGQGSILTITSYANRTSPVLRGKWVLENLLAAAPPPPPPNVPALKIEGPEPGQTLTMREAMTMHRASPACAGCHARMDPIGFSMENFDAVGRWRDRDSGNPIDAGDGMRGLRKMLLEHSGEFVSAFTEKLLMYAVGRNLQYYDSPAIREIVRSAAPGKYAFSSLVLGVVKSVPFQMRRSAS